MQRTSHILLVVLVLASVLTACSAQPTQTPPIVSPTQILDSGQGITSGDPPVGEAAVPRISIEEAKAALDNGEAIMVDVRSPAAYEASHIVGAVSVPLGEIERSPLDLPLDENQWIITYCT
jgi:hypothetical protein